MFTASAENTITTIHVTYTIDFQCTRSVRVETQPERTNNPTCLNSLVWRNVSLEPVIDSRNMSRLKLVSKLLSCSATTLDGKGR